MRTDDVIVVGSGVGGLVCALSMAPRAVTLITKTLQLEGGSSLWVKYYYRPNFDTRIFKQPAPYRNVDLGLRSFASLGDKIIERTIFDGAVAPRNAQSSA